MKKWIFVILLFSSSAHAEWSIELHLKSRHLIDEIVQDNEDNYGFGVGYQFQDNWKIAAGVYLNSLITHHEVCGEAGQAGPGEPADVAECSLVPQNVSSRYLSVERTFFSGDFFELGLGAGVADGYEHYITLEGMNVKKLGEYQFFGGPYLNIGTDLSVKLRYMFQVASFGLEYSF